MNALQMVNYPGVYFELHVSSQAQSLPCSSHLKINMTSQKSGNLWLIRGRVA